MASNRPSKSERQKRNRAQREARAARSANAGEATELYQSSPEDTGADDAGPGRGEEAGGEGPAPAKRRRAQKAAASRAAARQSRYQYPGQRAVVLALLFAIASVGLLVFTDVPIPREADSVDDVPAGIEDDQIDEPDDDGSVTYRENARLLDEEPLAYALAVMLVPVAITGGAVYFKDHERRSTIWTFAMLGLAGYVFLLAGPYALFALPPLIALGVGGFQARRDENKERMAELKAEREARKEAEDDGGSRDAEVIDVEPVEEDGPDHGAAEDEPRDEEAGDGVAEDEPGEERR